MAIFWILLIGGVILIYLLWSEIKSQDCLNRTCINSTPPVNLKDSFRTAIDKTIETLRKNHIIVGWRRALMIAIIVSIPIILFLLHRWPSGFEFLITVTIIFVIVYFSSVWLQAFWWGQNDLKIERSLMEIRRSLSTPKQNLPQKNNV